jgi:hypothetical protein
MTRTHVYRRSERAAVHDTFKLIDMCTTIHAYTCHTSCVNASWHMCEWVMAHVWMSHGTRVNESWPTCEWVMAQVWMSHGTRVPCVTRFMHTHATPHSYVCHDSFTCVPSLIHMCAITHSHVCHNSFTCVPQLIHMCAITHSHVCHPSRRAWLISLSAAIEQSKTQSHF